MQIHFVHTNNTAVRMQCLVHIVEVIGVASERDFSIVCKKRNRRYVRYLSDFCN